MTGAAATSEPGACCALCAAHADCEVWTIYESRCYLKSAACSFVQHEGSVSGGVESWRESHQHLHDYRGKLQVALQQPSS